MATLEEVYNQIIADDEQKAAFAEAAQTDEGLAKFLTGHGCSATVEEARALLAAKSAEEGELSDDELDDVAGGCGSDRKRVSHTLEPGVPCQPGLII